MFVKKNEINLRLDFFLKKKFSSYKRNFFQNLIKKKNVFVNKIYKKKNYLLKNNDVIEIFLKKKKFHYQKMKLHLLYEDEYILIINKKSGLVVHPGNGNKSMTLSNGLHFYFKNKKIININININDNYPFLGHRIDKGTSGLILVSKSEKILKKISKQFWFNKIKRKYITLVWGIFFKKEGTIICNIGRCLKNKTHMNVFPNGFLGKQAITHYKVLETFKYFSLLKCSLETGRTHQIRVHLKYIGHPIFNDKNYGEDKKYKNFLSFKERIFLEKCLKTMKYQALHAYYLEFKHPISLKNKYLISPIPEKFKFLIKKIKNFCL
ncbi:MAG: RluA family pseudouridine synthase [Candidatus Karelsulcia muelleri]